MDRYDNRAVQFDRCKDGIAEPHEPGPLIFISDWDEVLIDFPFLSCLYRNRWKNEG